MAEETKLLTDSIYVRLMEVQQALKAPKDQTGRFGSHRSAEGILKAVKPLLKEQSLALTLDSQMVEVGGRNYVNATATVYDWQGECICVSAQAWEGDGTALNSKNVRVGRGLDSPQITGVATSYARKYALGGLFDIDDSKDDPDSHHQEAAIETETSKKATGPEKFRLQQMMKARNMTADEMTLFIESVINKKKVDTHDDFVEVHHALTDGEETDV